MAHDLSSVTVYNHFFLSTYQKTYIGITAETLFGTFYAADLTLSFGFCFLFPFMVIFQFSFLCLALWCLPVNSSHSSVLNWLGKTRVTKRVSRFFISFKFATPYLLCSQRYTIIGSLLLTIRL